MSPQLLEKRPLSVTIVACVYIAVGAIGFAAHFPELLAWQADSVWVESTELLAVVSGALMLRGQNWARWLAIAWIGFHVGLSAFGNLRELAVHALFFVLIAWILFRPRAARYFRRQRIDPA